MKVLSKLNSLDNVNDGDTRKLITKTSKSGTGNVVSSISVSGDTISYTKGINALTSHQNAFSTVKVGSTNVAADKAGDTLELVAGSNITLTPDSTNDKVTIAATQPTVNNGTLTIQKNGTNVQTFTANQSSNVTANITVPTKTSELTNDSGYTSNTGTITGIKMNGASKGTSGVVDLGTVITSHQDISGKVNKAGDTMSGLLNMRDPAIDSTLKNNGISSTFYPTTFNICDKNGKTMTRMEAAVEPSGDISAY